MAGAFQQGGLLAPDSVVHQAAPTSIRAGGFALNVHRCRLCPGLSTFPHLPNLASDSLLVNIERTRV